MFDMGCDAYSRPPAFKRWPTEPETLGGKTALLDADLLPYYVGHTIKEFEFFKAMDRVKSGECETLDDTPECKDAKDQVDWTINHWISSAGCVAAKLFLTSSANNYRLDVAIQEAYKGERNPEKPPFFYELKEHIVKAHDGILAIGNEADDLIVTALYDQHYELEADGVEIGSEAHKQFSTLIAISTDKDLRMAAGWHFNPVEQKLTWSDNLGELTPKWKDHDVVAYEFWPLHNGEPVPPASPLPKDTFMRGAKKGQLKTKRVKAGTRKSQRIDKLKGTGLKFFYAQILMGDSVDCYSGCKGIGATKAYELLDSCKSEEELYAKVLGQYTETYGDSCVVHNYRGGKRVLSAEQLLTEQGRLAYMQRRAGDVWNKHVDLPLGTDKEAWQ